MCTLTHKEIYAAHLNKRIVREKSAGIGLREIKPISQEARKQQV
jgi:hypothetical protein